MKLIGDPHLGREFKANVPLDRRGEREEMMLNQFTTELFDAEDDLIVIVGDLFEHWFISYDALYESIKIIITWEQCFPDKKLVIMQGNHDYSPSEGIRGAFDVLDLALRPYDNIHVVRASQTLYGVMFFPWQWDRTAEEQLDDITEWTSTAIGHWDLEHFGHDTGHMCPARLLQEKGVTTIYSGHWHLAGIYDIDGVEVVGTGSMQPMTHAEDPEGKLYVTLTIKEYLRTPPESLRDKYVRVTVFNEEDVSPPETCLGFKIDRWKTNLKPNEKVTLGEFDMNKILDESFEKHEVQPDIRSEIKGKLSDLA